MDKEEIPPRLFNHDEAIEAIASIIRAGDVPTVGAVLRITKGYGNPKVILELIKSAKKEC